MTETINPVTLITGAASAIGIASACTLASVATGGLILIDRDEDRIAATADSLPHAPERVSTLAFDTADQKWWRKGSEFIEGQYGRLDWAVVNAGVSQPGQGGWRGITTLEIEAAVLSLRAIIALMQRNRDGGSIVLTGGFGSAKARGDKAGLPHVLHVAAKEGARYGIRVNAVTPNADPAVMGAAPIFEELVRQLGNPRAALARLADAKAATARFGGDDIAGLILNLLSDSSSLTGATLVAEGGYTL